MRNLIERLSQLIATYDNDDAVAYSFAIQNITEGKPAYWAKVKYHDAMTWGIIGDAHMSDLDDALNNVPYFKRDQIPAYLDRLIPLNDQATAELNKAKEQYSGE